MKKLLFTAILLCFFVPSPVCAQFLNPYLDFDNSCRRILEQAYDAFDEKNFGTAFRLAETAKERWKVEKEQALATLDTSLSQPALLKAGDDFETVFNLLKERNNIAAVRIIESVLVRLGFQDFDYSIKNFVAYIKNTAYPEADFLMGKLYMIEGEYDLAENFYSSAYEQRKYLDVPNMQFDILTDLAELYKLTADNEKYEAVLLILVSADSKYKQNGNSSAFIKAVNCAVKRGMDADKVFLLYRNDNYKTVYAWFQLAMYYQSLDSDEKAFESALLFCITVFSRAVSIIKSRDMDYVDVSMSDLLHKIQGYPDINEWASKNKIWEGFYLLGKTSRKLGYDAFAADIFSALAKESPERTWNVLAQKELDTF